MTDFFFISSPLHLMMAANMVIRQPSAERVAVLIAKSAAANTRYAAFLRQVPLLFSEVVVVPPPERRLCRFSRSPAARLLRQVFERPMAARIFTGNDRRIEFQYAMHIASRINRDVEGLYLDEGAVTYTGHKSMHSIQHRYVDPLFKKLVYGSWYRQAMTTGTSAWVDTVYAAFPSAVHPLLRGKKVLPIDPAPFATDAFKALALAMLNGHEEYREGLRGIRVVITLPHEGSYINRPARYQAISRDLAAVFEPAQIAVKPHPRITDAGLVRQMFPGALLLDHTVGMEALLPLLGGRCLVVGDISSTLLTTRWLRPDLPVVAVLSPDTPAGALGGLYETLHIPMLAPEALAAWLDVSVSPV